MKILVSVCLQKALLEADGIEVLWNGKCWCVDLKKYGWETTAEDAETFSLVFEKSAK